MLVAPVAPSYDTAAASTPQIAAARSMRRCLICRAVWNTLADIPGADQVAIQGVAELDKLLELAPLPAGGGQILTAFFLATLDSANQPIPTPFEASVLLTVTLPGSVGASLGDLTIAHWDDKAWVAIESKAVRSTSGEIVVSADVKHFTPFAVIAARGGIIGAATPKPPAAGSGAFVTAPNFAAGNVAFAVFGGGTVDQLEAAAKASATGVWVQDATGRFHLLVVNGPAFLRQEFNAAFPLGFTASLAVTLVR